MNDREEGKYRIGAVARITGLSTHTLRVWERRYAAVGPSRSEGGDRLFSDRDIDRLRAIKRLTDNGHALSQIAGLPDEHLFALVEDHAAASYGDVPAADVRARFVTSLAALDVTEAERIITRAAALYGPRALLFEIVAPILQQVGDDWERGALRIAHEHAASAMLRNLVGTVMRLEPRPSDAPTVVSTTLPGELHEFGALMAALLAAAYRWNVLYLGPNLPADEITAAIATAGAEVLFLSFVNDECDGQALDRLLASLPPTMSLVAGGRGVASARARLDGRPIITTVDSLQELERWIDNYDRQRAASA